MGSGGDKGSKGDKGSGGDKRRMEGEVGVEGTRGEGGVQGHYKPQRHGKPSCITKNQKKTLHHLERIMILPKAQLEKKTACTTTQLSCSLT